MEKTGSNFLRETIVGHALSDPNYRDRSPARDTLIQFDGICFI